MDKYPNILAVVESAGIGLRKQGKEYLGRCPFHDDRHASMSVNAEKGLWHCFSCNEGGDAIRFVEKLHGVGFKAACKILGLENGHRPPKARPSPLARQIAAWANDRHLKAQSKLRDLSRRIAIAHDAGWREEIDRLEREFQILSILSDDLQIPPEAIGMYTDPQARQWVENILAEVAEEPPQFPAITADTERLKNNCRGDE